MKFPDIREQFPFDAVVLANGEQPAHDVPLNILREAPYVVCCDGAIQHCDWADAVVGDCDSIPSWAREEYDIIYHEEDDQEENDLTKATRFCLSEGFTRLVFLGATGMREDHAMGNISLLMRYARELQVQGLMATNYGWFVPVIHSGSADDSSKDARPVPVTHEFASFPGQQVSIFNFGCTQLTTEGLRYDGYPFASLWQGTLNEATADSFRITADGDFLVFRTYEGK